MPADAPRAQLIHIETDRRLGHEWDEWDGKPLPGNGDFSAPHGLFFRLAALTLAVGFGATGALIFLLAPRLEAVLPALPALLWVALAVGAGACALWFVLLLLSFYGSVLLLPEGLLERRSEEHTSELQSRLHLVCRLLLEKKTTKPRHANQLPKRLSHSSSHMLVSTPAPTLPRALPYTIAHMSKPVLTLQLFRHPGECAA